MQGQGILIVLGCCVVPLLVGCSRAGSSSNEAQEDSGVTSDAGDAGSGDGGGRAQDAHQGGDQDAEEGLTGEVTPCPDHPDMILVATGQHFCIDAYEASNDGDGTAQSVAGEMPWVNVSWDQAAAACTAAGKRLCTTAEWRLACAGPNDWTYSWTDGPWDNGGVCNDLGANNNAAVASGSMEGCEGGYPGLFDMSGNIREWTSTCEGNRCDRNGGSYTNGINDTRCTATDDAGKGFTEASAGFRCCLNAP